MAGAVFPEQYVCEDGAVAVGVGLTVTVALPVKLVFNKLL